MVLLLIILSRELVINSCCLSISKLVFVVVCSESVGFTLHSPRNSSRVQMTLCCAAPSPAAVEPEVANSKR
jgi:hypothetical protein